MSSSSTTADFFPAVCAENQHIALREGDTTWRYISVHHRADQFASGLLADKADLEEERIAFFMPASLDYVTTLLGIWRAGGIAVPLNIASAVPELEHVLGNAGVTRVIVSGDPRDPTLALLYSLCRTMNIPLQSVTDLLALKIAMMPVLPLDRRALILYTSGTTDKPKGVVSTFRNIRAQVTTLTRAWAWEEVDFVPLFLPLHHIHGIINVLCCGLWAGAHLTLYPRFDMETILNEVADGKYTAFMAVPTIYVKIVQYLESIDTPLNQARREAICTGFRNMRLNVSGSSACPVKLHQQWYALTGQTILERYGMTEIGMGLSNPYEGQRRAGAVGVPLPGVEVALFDDEGNTIEADSTPGEIRVRGENVFLEYWNNPEATEESFADGWFCTGDVAIREDGYYRILGRSSIDIIKSGGYKISALEIEGTLLTHEKIAECAVVGVEDDTWGEAVTAFVVLKPGQLLGYSELKTWCETHMSPYKIPKALRVVDKLPRNSMGKVMKPELKKMA